MHDLAVIGLGALGIHVVREAAYQGFDVVGIEAEAGGHEHAATGGMTRIFRLAYTFGADYVPALQRAKTVWDRLASIRPQTRFDTGALMIGAADDPEIANAVSTAESFALPHELLDAEAVASRWPMHHLLPGDIALYDPAGALLVPPAVTEILKEEAEGAGADLRYGCSVTAVEEYDDGSVVRLADGHEVQAKTVVVAAGAWSGSFAREFDRAVELRRATLHWFVTPDEIVYGPRRFPVGLRRSGDIRYSFFPQVDDNGIKINLHAPKPAVGTPEENEAVLPVDMSVLVSGLRRTMLGLGRRSASAAYVESYTPDYRILLGPVTDTSRRWLLAGGSGQAFKLAPVLAEHLVERIKGQTPTLSLDGVVQSPSESGTEAVPGP